MNRGTLALSVLGVCACRPGAFDDLSGGGARARDAGAIDAGGLDAALPPGDAATDDASLGDAGAGCRRPEGVPLSLTNADVAQIATLVDPETLAMRAPGPSAWLGDHITYTFGSTRPAPSDAEAVANYASAAVQAGRPPWVGAPDAQRTWELEEQLDARGLPYELLPLRPEEQGTDTSLVPASLVHTAPGELGGTLYVIETGWDLKTRKVWLASLADGATVATRAAEPLFVGNDPMFVRGAHRGQNYVKVYACEQDTALPATDPRAMRCYVARAPVGELALRTSYTAYRSTGEGEGVWDADLSKATPVLHGPANTLSVDWNGYLNAFVAVHGKLFEHKVVVQTAPASEGPWTPVAELALPPNPHAATAVTLHGGAACDDRLIVSYLAPTEMDGFFPVAGKVVFVSIDLR